MIDSVLHINTISQETCNRRLGEFERVEKTLSDFQRSNVDQMDTINKNGIYEIKGIPGKILHRVDDSLQLFMRRTTNDQDRNSFSLEELKELQSKLVLVAAENADGVNKFIEVCTCV